jgi:hypothetical protein
MLTYEQRTAQIREETERIMKCGACGGIVAILNDGALMCVDCRTFARHGGWSTAQLIRAWPERRHGHDKPLPQRLKEFGDAAKRLEDLYRPTPGS